MARRAGSAKRLVIPANVARGPGRLPPVLPNRGERNLVPGTIVPPRLEAAASRLGLLTSRGTCDHVVGASDSDWLPPIFDERLQANTVTALELGEIGRNQTKSGDPLIP